MSGSKVDNSIKQWKYDDTEAVQFRKLRERVGLSGNICSMLIQSNTEVVLNSLDQTLYVSLISDNNSYILPRCLDSYLPTHVAAKGKKLTVFRNQTKVKTINAEIEIDIAKISQSQNYYTVASGNTVVRLGGGDRIEWKLKGRVLDIVVVEPYYIFVIVEGGALYYLPFAGPGQNLPEYSYDSIQRLSFLAGSLDRSKSRVT